MDEIVYVFPKKNEQTFIEIAKKLRLNKLVFIYTSIEDLIYYQKNIHKTHDILLSYGLAGDITFFRKNSLSVSLKIYTGTDYSSAVSSGLINTILFIHKPPIDVQQLSLTPLICKELKANNVSYAFSYTNFILDNKLTSKTLLRNIKLCIKYNISILCSCFTDNPADLRSTKDLSQILIYLQKRQYQ